MWSSCRWPERAREQRAALRRGLSLRVMKQHLLKASTDSETEAAGGHANESADKRGGEAARWLSKSRTGSSMTKTRMEPHREGPGASRSQVGLGRESPVSCAGGAGGAGGGWGAVGAG